MRTSSQSTTSGVVIALALAMASPAWSQEPPAPARADASDTRAVGPSGQAASGQAASGQAASGQQAAPQGHVSIAVPTPEELAAAPSADRARNVTKARPSHWTRHFWIVPQTALFVPRWTFAGAMWPVREGLFLVDRYDVIGRTARLFSGDGPITLAPGLILVAGQGITYGVEIGARDYVQARFLFGGEARRIYGLEMQSRELFGAALEFDAQAEIQLLRNSIFAGIGNESLASDAASGIAPNTDSTALETRYDQSIARVELGANWSMPRAFTLRLSGAYLRRRFEQPSDAEVVKLGDVYNADELSGFSAGFSQLYGEARITFDNRDQPSRWVSAALPTRGWKLTSFAGRHSARTSSFDDYTRLGMDIQRYQHLFGGDRVFIGRAQLEWISADVDAVPFVDLPGLGGSTILRGYRRGRFRDRIAALAVGEYRFPLHRQISGFLFLDAGKVSRDFAELRKNELHLGTGIGLHVHTANRLLMRLQLAGTREGVVVNASFSSSDRVRRTTKRR